MKTTEEKLESLHLEEWINGQGEKRTPIKFNNYNNQFKIFFCFQHWCPGCHSSGFPSLKKIVNAFEENSSIAFFVVQTVFEGHHENTFEKLIETQKKYNLQIPFAQDSGDEHSRNRSKLMNTFNTGGTPWFLFINQKNEIVFSDFHLKPEEAIEYLKSIL